MTLPFDDELVDARPQDEDSGTYVEPEVWRSMVLAAALEVAVPLKMARMAGWSPEQRIRYARTRWAAVTLLDGLSGGAELLFGGKSARHEFAALTGVLAALAYQPGGVTFAGMHWCADHGACEKAAVEAEERVNA